MLTLNVLKRAGCLHFRRGFDLLSTLSGSVCLDDSRFETDPSLVSINEARVSGRSGKAGA